MADCQPLAGPVVLRWDPAAGVFLVLSRSRYRMRRAAPRPCPQHTLKEEA
jgi:hypothetical protein